MTRGLPAAALERLRLAVARRLGLQIDDDRVDQLEEVAARRLAALGDPPADAWLERIEAGDPAELAALAERLTVGETYFFRSGSDLRAFAEAVVPARMAARAGERRLRFLSAGCSSGEEPYTLAMLLRGLPGLAGWDVAVRGVDVNPAALRKARAARYSEWSLRQTEAADRERFFEEARGELVVRPEVRAMVSFEQVNLVDDAAASWPPGAWDAVFCRNVLMYFSHEASQRVVDRVASALAPGGYLFLGHAETLRGVSTRFHLQHTHETFYYRLREGAEEARPPAPAPPRPPRAAAPDLLPPPPAEPAVAAAAPAPAVAAAAPAPPPSPAAGPIRLALALELLHAERYAEALRALEASPLDEERDPDALLLRAVVLASSGDPAGAEAACARVLERDELSAEAHYVKALCRANAGDLEGARGQDQYALYLDPTFAMPRLHLGLLAQRAGDRDAARTELSRALALLAGEDAARVLLLGGGFGREALAELCRAELRAAGGAA